MRRVERHDQVLGAVVGGHDLSGAVELDAVALAVVEREREHLVVVARRDRRAHRRVEATRQDHQRGRQVTVTRVIVRDLDHAVVGLPQTHAHHTQPGGLEPLADVVRDAALRWGCP